MERQALSDAQSSASRSRRMPAFARQCPGGRWVWRRCRQNVARIPSARGVRHAAKRRAPRGRTDAPGDEKGPGRIGRIRLRPERFGPQVGSFRACTPEQKRCTGPKGMGPERLVHAQLLDEVVGTAPAIHQVEYEADVHADTARERLREADVAAHGIPVAVEG